MTITIAIAVLASAYLLARRYPPGRVRAVLKELGTSALTTWRQVEDRKQTAAARLPWVKVPAGRLPTLEERCARILARITSTLSAEELHEQLHHNMADAVPSIATLRTTLAHHPAFVHVGQDRWHVGDSVGLISADLAVLE